jgi:hypothetical protein
VQEFREGGPNRCQELAPMPRLLAECQQITVLGAGVVDVRELRDQQSEVHGNSFDKK